MTAERLTRLMIDAGLLAALLLIGVLLRSRIRLFQKILLPSSLIAGFVGLLFGPQAIGLIPADTVATWSGIPGRLISVVFACMFLGVRVPSIRRIWNEAGPQICYGFFAGMGQYFIALLLTGIVLVPLFGVPPVFASLLEIGFSGGHGTASGMMEVFASLGFPDGADLGLMSATVGIFTSMIVGMLLINIAVRRGYALLIESPQHIPPDILSGILNKEHRAPIGTSTVSASTIDPLAFHAGFVGLAILLGWLIYLGITRSHPMLKSFPLFPLAMIGGILVQLAATALKIDPLFDRHSFERIGGVALDFLVVSAIASLNIQVVIKYAAPFALLMIAGIAWMSLLTWYLAPRMFPDAWFERAIVEFGMQTGVTAMGLMLLRVVDPRFDTEAAPSFGFKQIVYEPLLGGGLITSLSPIIIIQMGMYNALLISGSVMAAFMIIALVSKFFHRHPGPCR